MEPSAPEQAHRLRWSAGLAVALHLGVAALLAHDWIRDALLQPIEPLELPPIALDVALQPESKLPDDISREQWLNPAAEKLPPSQLEMKWTLGSMPVELMPNNDPKPVTKPIQLSFSDEVGAALRSGRPVRLPRRQALPSAIYEIALVDLSARQPVVEALGEAPDLAPSKSSPTSAPAVANADRSAAIAGRGETPKPQAQAPTPAAPAPATPAETTQSTERAAEAPAVTSNAPSIEPAAQPEEAVEPTVEPPAEVEVAETDPAPAETPSVAQTPDATPPPEPASEPPPSEPTLQTAEVAVPPSPEAAEPEPVEEPAELAAAPEPERPEQVNITPAPAEEPETEAAPDRGPGEWTANSSEFFSRLTAHIYDVNRAVLAVETASPRRLSLDVRFVMQRDGRVLEAEVLRSSGDPALDEAARAVLIAASPLPMLSDDMPQDRLQLIAPIEVYRR